MGHPADGSVFKNSCITSALAKGVLTTGVDSIGLLPEGGAVASAFSLWYGAAGASNGTKILQRVAFGGGLVTTAAAAHDASGAGGIASSSLASFQAGTGVVSIVKSLGGPIPVAGQVIAGVSVGLDLVSTGVEIANCH